MLTIACSHFILSFLLLLCPCKLCLFCLFEYKFPACYLFLSTRFSVVLPTSSIIIFSYVYLDSSSPFFLPVSFKVSHFSLQYCLSTLCTSQKDFSNSCHHPSLATREDSVCGDMQIYRVGRLCLHRQTLGKCDQGMMYAAKWQGDRQAERAGVRTTLNLSFMHVCVLTGRDKKIMCSHDMQIGRGRHQRSVCTREKMAKGLTEKEKNEQGSRKRCTKWCAHTHEHSCERAELRLMDDIKNPEKRQNRCYL